MPDSGVAGERQRVAPSSPATRRTARSLRGSNATACVGARLAAAAAAPCVSFWPGHDVRVGDHEPRRARPSPSPRRRARTRAEDLHDARAAASWTSGSRAIPARGGATPASGPSIRGNGSRRAQRVQQRPGRRQHRVEPLEDRRALDLHRGSGSRRSGPRARRGSTTTPSPTQAVRTRAEDPVDGAEAGRSAAARAGPAPRTPRSSRDQHRADDQRADQAEGGRPRRVRALGQHERPDPRARATRRARSRASASTPDTKPCAHPKSASSSTSPTMIQSTPVTDRAYERADRARSAWLRNVAGSTTRASQCVGDRWPRPRRSAPRSPARRRPPPRWPRASPASRFAPLVIAALAAFAVGIAVGARQRGPAPGRRASGSPTPGSAATTRRCTRCSTAEAQQRVPLRALRRRLPRRRRDDARSTASSPGRRPSPTRRRRRRAGRDADADLRHAARAARAAGRRAGRTAPAIDWRPQPRLPRPAPRREADARDARCRRARRSRRATARRSPRARTGSPTSARSPPRSPAASAPRRPSAPPSSSAAACPTARRSA